jgi:pullulanase
MKELLSKAPMFLLVLFLFQTAFAKTETTHDETLEIVSAFIMSPNQVKITLTQEVDTDDIRVLSNGTALAGFALPQQGQSYIIMVDETLDFTKKYEVQVGAKSKETQVHWKAIDDLYYYDGELGIKHFDNSTLFRLWAPLATKVEVLLYNSVEDESLISTHELQKGEKGVWFLALEGEYLGKFYEYRVRNYGEEKIVLDPYAFSKAVDDSDGVIVGKAAIVDPSAIGPELEYAEIEGYEKREDAIIWEIHVRDFTVDPDITTEARFGTYSAFTERLDYIKELGVTHVQLLPVMSYAHGSEMKAANREMDYAVSVNYNWGYDPHGYFAPEGMYSEDPTDPALRIKELKELIHAVHEQGMGLTLDVVYNHTASLGILEDIVPGYYHFMDAAGEAKQSYGGGRVGTTHAMARKLVIDSILFWLTEYKVDGFRFDLMGDLDALTVQMLWDEAVKINPNVHMVGECWRTYAGDEGEDVRPADQDWMHLTNSVACFSDEMRNELKSGYGSEGEARFITGGARNIQTIFNNIIAKPGNMSEDDPGDVLQYIAAHDNLTLHDVIAHSADLDPATEEEEIQQRIRLGNTIILTSQGVAFLHAGQEYGRTKQWKSDEVPEKDYTFVEGFEHPYFIENSYDASDAVNMFDWDKVMEPGIHKETMEFTKGLIALRKSTDAFRHDSEFMVRENVEMLQTDDIAETDLIIGFKATATNGETYYVVVNADSESRTLRIGDDLNGGVILVDSDEAGTEEVSDLSGVYVIDNEITIAPLTATVIKK